MVTLGMRFFNENSRGAGSSPGTNRDGTACGLRYTLVLPTQRLNTI